MLMKFPDASLIPIIFSKFLFKSVTVLISIFDPVLDGTLYRIIGKFEIETIFS